MGTLALLIAIALIDSTSIGTLIIPLWLMFDNRRSAKDIVIYLTTISIFYFLFGLALLSGTRFVFDMATERLSDFFSSTVGIYMIVSIGAVLIIVSFLIEPKRLQRRREARGIEKSEPLIIRISNKNPRTSSTIILAFIAGIVEVATMLPYLAAIGIIATLDTATFVRVGILAAYCMIMSLPAFILLIMKLITRERMKGKLDKVRLWLLKHSEGTISLLLLIVGIKLVLLGLGMLGY